MIRRIAAMYSSVCRRARERERETRVQKKIKRSTRNLSVYCRVKEFVRRISCVSPTIESEKPLVIKDLLERLDEPVAQNSRAEANYPRTRGFLSLSLSLSLFLFLCPVD